MTGCSRQIPKVQLGTLGLTYRNAVQDKKLFPSIENVVQWPHCSKATTSSSAMHASVREYSTWALS